MGFLSYLSGYLVLSVTGRYSERFINLCALNGIYIKDAVKGEDGIIIKTSKKAFRKMIKPSYRAKCKVKIIKKAGLYFKLRRIGKRKIFIAGAAVSAALLLFLNSFIWTVRVDGNEKFTDEEIKFLAAYCGLRQGVVKYSLDEKKFSENALKTEPGLSWIWPEIKGTVCYIHVREKTSYTPPVNVKEPCSVIAKRSGIITDITVKRGWAEASEGDSVVKGQVLIRGEKEGFSPVHAMGEVFASYWTEKSGVASAEKEIVTYTGREKSYYSLIIGSFGMSFRFSGKAPYESCEEEKTVRDVKLFGEISLPVQTVKTVYKETVREKITRSEKTAVEETVLEITEDFKKNLPSGTELKNTAVKTEPYGQNTLVTVVFECSEDIAITDINER